MAKAEMINNLRDLINCWGDSGDSINLLSKRIYNGTDCGAWIQLIDNDGKWYDETEFETLEEGYIKGFRIGTIVEGSDYYVESEDFLFPVTAKKMWDWVEEMEAEANRLWHEANDDYDEDDEGDD